MPLTAKPTRKMPKRYAPALDAVGLIDRFYYRENEKPSKRSQGVMHPSGLLSCLRAQQLDLVRAPRNKQAHHISLLRIFDHGHWVEAKLRRALEEGAQMQGGQFLASVKVADRNLLLEGETDGLLVSSTSDSVVIDFKGWNADKYNALVEPPDYYVAQLHAYMWCLRVPHSALVFENKNTQALQQIDVPWDRKLWEWIRGDIIGKVIDATVHNELLPRDDSKCDKGCAYRAVCFSSDDLELQDVDRRPAIARRKLKVLD